MGKKVYIKAYSCDEEAFFSEEIGDELQYAELDVTDEFCERLEKLRSLCIEHDLSELRVYYAPVWGPADVADDLNLMYDEMVVTKSSFWFVAETKYSEHPVNTQLQDIDEFIAAIHDSCGDDPLYFGDFSGDGSSSAPVPIP